MDIFNIGAFGKLKMEAEYFDDQLGMKVKREFEIPKGGSAEKEIWKIIKENNCQSVRARISLWDDNLKEWFVDTEKTYYDSSYTGQEYLLLKDGAHEHRFPTTSIQEMIIHLPSKVVFYVDARVDHLYPEHLLNDPEILFYKFKYTDEDEIVHRFTLCCSLRGNNFSKEKLAEIKENILKPGAKWFCEHYCANNEKGALVKIVLRMQGLL